MQYYQRKELFSWNSTMWINVADTHFTYAKYCPLHYCNLAGKQIELKNEPFAQCAFNRAGRLCGGYKENYSLAIGPTASTAPTTMASHSSFSLQLQDSSWCSLSTFSTLLWLKAY